MRALAVGIVLAARDTQSRIGEGHTCYSGLGYGAKTRGDLALASAHPSTPGLLNFVLGTSFLVYWQQLNA